MVLVIVSAAMAIVTVAKSVADNPSHILLQLAAVVVAVITMMPAQKAACWKLCSECAALWLGEVVVCSVSR